MNRKKDRSGRVAVIAAAIVTLIAGVSVVSLYSMSADSKNTNALTLAASSIGTETGKLNLKPAEDSGALEGKAVDAKEAAKAPEAKPAAQAKTEEVKEPDVPAASEQIAPAPSLPAPSQADPASAEDQYELPAEEVYYEEQPAADSSEYVYAEEDGVYYGEEEVLNAQPAEPVYEEPVYEETVYEEYAEESVYVEETAYDAYAGEADGEWIFDYDTEEWVYVYNYSSYAEPVSYQEEPAPAYEGPEGEWMFDYDTEEWYFVPAAVYSAPAHVAEEPAYTEASADPEGEWLFDYDTEEWYFVPAAVYSAPAHVAEEPAYTEASADPEGEWLFDYDTEEWYFVAGAPAQEPAPVYEEPAQEGTSEASEGEWLFDQDTEEWYYVEGSSGNTDSGYEVSEEDNSEEDWSEEPEYEEPVYSSLGQQIVDYALGFVGVTPYVSAGRSLYSGTDCSGFVNLIYGSFGIYCSPASMAYNGSGFGYLISYDQLQPGDIVVYGGGGHVAIYAGNGYVVHCSSPENGTVYWNMNYRSDISWFLRVL